MFPNIRSITLDGWDQFEDELEYLKPLPSSFQPGTSQVETAYLPGCGASEVVLREILTWPEALKELWYEADPARWDTRGEPLGFSCTAVSRAFAPLHRTLEKLVITRQDSECGGLFYNGLFNLQAFTQLKYLSIYHVLWIGHAEFLRIWINLPSSLESLNIWFDNIDNAGFVVDDNGEDLCPAWLSKILKQKAELFERLGKMRIVENLEYDIERPRFSMNLAHAIKNAFVEAGVSYSVVYNTGIRFKADVPGGTKWDEDDSWDEGEMTRPE